MHRIIAVAAAVTLIGCGVGTEATVGGESTGGISYEQFLSSVYQEADTGVFITDGDTPFEDEAGLYAFWLERLSGQQKAVAQQSLAIYNVSGTDVKWSSTAARNITYCVSQSSFGSNYTKVVQAMASAAAAWESVGNVNFVHLSQYDSSCSSRTSGVVFNVRKVSSGQYLARAFFPNSSRRSREVLIDSSSFTVSAPLTLTGILRHELGHTLGFRHEHTRPEAGACFEDNNWRALTSYDAASVMHYPQCNGTGDWSLTLTSKDASGARLAYP